MSAYRYAHVAPATWVIAFDGAGKVRHRQRVTGITPADRREADRRAQQLLRDGDVHRVYVGPDEKGGTDG